MRVGAGSDAVTDSGTTPVPPTTSVEVGASEVSASTVAVGSPDSLERRMGQPLAAAIGAADIASGKSRPVAMTAQPMAPRVASTADATSAAVS